MSRATLKSTDDLRARQLAQSDPVPAMTARLGEYARDAKVQFTYCVTTLRELDKIRDQLAEHGITVDVDLGPIGNAAAAARRDLERERPAQFEMPR